MNYSKTLQKHLINQKSPIYWLKRFIFYPHNFQTNIDQDLWTGSKTTLQNWIIKPWA